MAAPGATEAGRGRALVDDDPKLAHVAVRRERAWVTGEAADQALWALTQDRPAIIVVDVMMPHPSGIEVCRHLRNQGWPGGVVIVTTRTSPADGAAALRAGADAFLGNRLPLGHLVAAVDASTARCTRCSVSPSDPRPRA